MNPITHVLTGWCLAEAFPQLSTREKGLVTFAAVAPDLDGLGLVAELATRDSARPLLWWTEYHHVLGHNLLFACVAALFARRLLTASLVFLAVHLHILGDLAGSRGPDQYQWPIPYLWPFSGSPQLAWSGQWYLNAWPNIVLTIVLLVVTFRLAWRRGYSILGLVSSRGDAAFVEMLRARFGAYIHPSMAAYIVSRVRIVNREPMQRYMSEAPATVAAFGGRYLVRGGDVQALEGAWEHERMVVVEFPDKAAALGWYHSEVYRPLRDLRQANAEAVILLAEGVPPPV